MGATIHHFRSFSARATQPAGEVYAAVEAPKGELTVFSMAPTGTTIQNPGPLVASVPGDEFLSRGHMLADVSAILGSLDIVFGEID